MTPALAPILQVRDVSLAFGGLQVLRDVSFDVARGSIVALIGPNGAGKTTLFNVATGFVAADGGAVTYEGRRIERFHSHRVAQLGLVRTFQTTRVLHRLTVFDNMLLAMPGHPGERMWPIFLRPRRVQHVEATARDRAMTLLARFKLEPLAHEYAGVLSGGQRKLLELARALMLEPRMILLDEPLAGVNPVLGAELLRHIAAIRDEQGVTVLFVEHDMGAVMAFAETVIVMAQGSVIAAGTPDEVRRDQRVVDAYLGAK